MYTVTATVANRPTIRITQQVAEVTFKVEPNPLMAVPKPQQLPSPRAQWEAVEKAGYKPIALKGPFCGW